MALRTANVYGSITIADEAVSMVVSKVARECYGVAELVSRRLSDSVLAMFNKVPVGKGVKLVTEGNKIFIDLYVLIVEGVNVEAVVESLKSAVTYHVELFTGMCVKSINVHVLGMKLL